MHLVLQTLHLHLLAPAANRSLSQSHSTRGTHHSFYCRTPLVIQLHVLVLFIDLGVGADDIFVFFDAWRQSAQMPPHISASLTLRLQFALRRTASAVFNTSFTTAMAFIGSPPYTHFSP